MPEHEREELLNIVHEAVESAINKRVVSILLWIVGVGFANLAAVLTGVWMFWDTQHTARVAIADRWTGTMEYIAEKERREENQNYRTVDIRRIQSENKPN